MLASSLACTHALLRVLIFFRLQLCFKCQVTLNTSLPKYAEVYKPIYYSVVGQQKSGTSTLWNILTSNPAIKWVGHGKESFYFGGELPRTTLCDNLVEEYQSLVAVQRLLANRSDLIIGDWSATHFSCSCCPLALKTLNIGLKIIILLRDPVQRTLSRFLEQKRNPKMPFHNLVFNYTFADYVNHEARSLENCVARAAPLRQPHSGPDVGAGSEEHHGKAPLLGWGAGLDMGRWIEMQCFSRSNIIGWSVYDVFLENYLAHFPQEQILVLYTDELANHPLESVRHVEAFLGAPPHQYDTAILNLVYNSRDCYHWRCARKKDQMQQHSQVLADSSEGGTATQQQESARNGIFTEALTRLVELYRPHVQRLMMWADEGRIAQPPEAWRKQYG